jgi:hypothetical protein
MQQWPSHIRFVFVQRRVNIAIALEQPGSISPEQAAPDEAVGELETLEQMESISHKEVVPSELFDQDGDEVDHHSMTESVSIQAMLSDLPVPAENDTSELLNDVTASTLDAEFIHPDDTQHNSPADEGDPDDPIDEQRPSEQLEPIPSDEPPIDDDVDELMSLEQQKPVTDDLPPPDEDVDGLVDSNKSGILNATFSMSGSDVFLLQSQDNSQETLLTANIVDLGKDRGTEEDARTNL